MFFVVPHENFPSKKFARAITCEEKAITVFSFIVLFISSWKIFHSPFLQAFAKKNMNMKWGEKKSKLK